jgi:hypothetical protein
MIRATARWAKVVGDPQLSYDKLSKEWTIDCELDDETVEKVLQDGCSPVYIKERDDGTKFIKFTRKEKTQAGEDAKPYRIVDDKGKPWDGKTLIGNGSILNIKYALNDVTMGKNKGAQKPSLMAIQVWKLESYGEDFPVNEDGEESWD